MVEVRYQLPNYKELMKNFPCSVLNVIGNHDNDPKVVGDYFTWRISKWQNIVN